MMNLTSQKVTILIILRMVSEGLVIVLKFTMRLILIFGRIRELVLLVTLQVC